jgi:putative methyltransferase (TIGR04325 family)
MSFNLRYFLPPFVVDVLHFLEKNRVGFTGKYSEFDKALQKSTSYESLAIVEDYIRELNKIVSEKQQLSYFNFDTRSVRILAALRLAENGLSNKKIRVLDFGGGLGTHYFKVFEPFKDILEEYVILETPLVAERFSELNKEIKYVTDLENTEPKSFDICLASCSIPYVENPYSTLTEIMKCSKYIILDRMPFVDSINSDVLKLQKSITSNHSRVSYPSWLMSRSKFLSFCDEFGHEIVSTWEVPEDRPYFKFKRFSYSGYLIKCVS